VGLEIGKMTIVIDIAVYPIPIVNGECLSRAGNFLNMNAMLFHFYI